MSRSMSVGYMERLPLSPEELTGLGGLMFEFFMRPGKGRSSVLNNEVLTTSTTSLNVCVGDMNTEQGEKLASELPG
jgi:hypothetical protein